MKKQIAMIAFGLVATSSAFAASSKICFGMGNDKGSRFQIDLTKKTAKISAASGEAAEPWEGQWPASGSLNGRDGKLYLAYELPDGDGPNTLLVDSALLTAEGAGQAKIRWRGGSFSESKFFCRNASN